MSQSPLDLNKYPTIAFSDAVNSACCWAACYMALEKGREDVAVGAGIVALASTVGTLRFGFAPKQLAHWNNLLASFGGTVGVPLIGFGFARSRGVLTEILQSDSDAFPVKLSVGMTLAGVMIRRAGKPKLEELYTTLLCVASMGCLLYGEGFMENPMAVAAVSTFVFAGVVVGSDRHRYTFGVRHENWFHYFLGASMLMFGKALGA